MDSTGPILATGAIALFNEAVIAGQPVKWKIPVGTAIAAGGLALLEHAWHAGAVGLSWLALVTILFVRVDPNVPAPAEAFNKWWSTK